MAQIKYIGSNADHLYNDGDQVETDILNYVKEHKKNEYWDILSKDSRWPVFYHLSDMRENILNWYDFKPEADILEIGAGMGAVTGLLCEKAKSVISVELTHRRAEVIYNRYTEYDNLTILVGNFNEMEFMQKFDYITLIGVLEYAPGFTTDGEPATFIRKIKSLLKPGGKLLIAIENRFGLKYWCGAGEDHTGQPYDGINGYPENKDVRTFSRTELTDLLDECGLRKHRFYYPLPDYKLPQVIYSDEYLPKHKISSKIRQYYLGEPLLLADEGKLYRDVIENEAFPFMANSFFVECSEEENAEKHPIFALFTPERKEEYRITTKIYSDDTVRKYAVFPQGEEHLKRIYDHQSLYKGDNLEPYRMADGYLEMPFICADESLEDILCRLIRNGDIENTKRWMNRFYDEVILKSSDLTGEADQRVLEHGFLDLTFENCFISGDRFSLFDQEWMEDHISPEFIMFHAIRVLYWQNPDLEEFVPFETMILFYIGSTKNIPAFTQHNIDILMRVYSITNALNFLDANKGIPERDALAKLKQSELAKETICSFFFDDGNGFSEEKSQKIKIDTSLPDILISEEVRIPAGCKTVRIDPGEGFQCAISDVSFSYDDNTLTYQIVSGFRLNEIIVFPTEDPQLLVRLPETEDGEPILKAKMRVRYYSLKDPLFSCIYDKERETEEQIRNIRKVYVHKLIEKTEEYETDLRNIHEQVSELTDRCAHFEQEYNRISHSFCWKMTKPIRVILDGSKKRLRKCKRLNLAILGAKWRRQYGEQEAQRLKEEYIKWNYQEK